MKNTKSKKKILKRKKAKTAAARVEPEIVAERRIWEMDTDAEEDIESHSDKTLSARYAQVRY
jgi:hypothetical protein